jgi:hypothetical protein
MRHILLLPVLLLAAAGAQAAPLDSDHVEPAFYWSGHFGGSAPPSAALGLELRYRVSGARQAAAAPALFALDLDPAGLLAKMAGAPLLQQRFRVNQAEAAELPVATHWYTHQWVWWTAGGVAATAALASAVGGSDNEERHCTGTCNQTQTGPNLSIDAQNGSGIGCIGQNCVACNNGDIASDCTNLTSRSGEPWLESRDAEIARRSIAGTGGMGQLIAR